MKRITKCEDGKYRWVYEFSLLKNPTIFLLLLKIFGLITAGMWVFMNLIELFDGGYTLATLWACTKVMLLIFGILVGLTVIGYLIYAAIMGGKYCVLFEMDEEGVSHIQMKSQIKKAELLSAIEVLAGFASSNPTLMGAGLLSSSVSSISSCFAGVKKMKVLKKRCVIKLDQPFCHNQVYAEPEDFDFVVDFIKARVNV